MGAPLRALRAALPCRLRCSLPYSLHYARRPALPCRAAARCYPAATCSLPCSAPHVRCPRCPHALPCLSRPELPCPTPSRPAATAAAVIATTGATSFLATAAQLVTPPLCHCCLRAAPARAAYYGDSHCTGV
ncbi:unnamed protein product [Closterium sp. NIES-54]